MRLASLAIGTAVLVLGSAALVTELRVAPGAQHETWKDREPEPPTQLAFSELLERRRGPHASSRARDLDGHRVQMVGFMADMERPPREALYLVPRPVSRSAAGRGAAGLPPEAVLVVLPEGNTAPTGHVPGELEATGTLEIGTGTDDLGRTATFRIHLEVPIEKHIELASQGL